MNDKYISAKPPDEIIFVDVISKAMHATIVFQLLHEFSMVMKEYIILICKRLFGVFGFVFKRFCRLNCELSF